ncbi:MAG: ribonuclease III [Candidatus Melainabacteria bacterium]|nr:ribonuclease III [Candidatus Melainabacteria bacterium]
MKSGVSFKTVATCNVQGEIIMELELPHKRLKDLDTLCASLGLNCGKMGLINEALTHSSYSAENPGYSNYEKLEFFGDAVLKFVVSEYLLDRFPEYMEGQLTEIRAVLVSDKVLAEIARDLGLDRYILLGKQVQMRPSIMADSLEALIGAVYQDQGLFQVQNLIVRLFGSHATSIDRDEIKDNYKAQLQEYTQARAQGLPAYTVLHSEGPAHEPTYTIAVSIAGDAIATGTGGSKKQAEQEAAKNALARLTERD